MFVGTTSSYSLLKTAERSRNVTVCIGSSIKSLSHCILIQSCHHRIKIHKHTLDIKINMFLWAYACVLHAHTLFLHGWIYKCFWFLLKFKLLSCKSCNHKDKNKLCIYLLGLIIAQITFYMTVLIMLFTSVFVPPKDSTCQVLVVQ